VNALLLQALLCVSHNGTITDAVLTGFGGCFEILKNFGYHISGASPASMMSSLRAAALLSMSHRAPPAPQSVGGFFAVGIVKRACVTLQAAMRCKLVLQSRRGAPDHSAALASRVKLLKTRASAALDQEQPPIPASFPAPVSRREDASLLFTSTRGLHLSKAPSEEPHTAFTGFPSSLASVNRIDDLHTVQPSREVAAANGENAQTEEDRLKNKIALHQQVRCGCFCGVALVFGTAFLSSDYFLWRCPC
jgi:hypothetical protein